MLEAELMRNKLTGHTATVYCSLLQWNQKNEKNESERLTKTVRVTDMSYEEVPRAV
jgi:hypothetical protein